MACPVCKDAKEIVKPPCDCVPCPACNKRDHKAIEKRNSYRATRENRKKGRG